MVYSKLVFLKNIMSHSYWALPVGFVQNTKPKFYKILTSQYKMNAEQKEDALN
jgi:hypothetical protein